MSRFDIAHNGKILAKGGRNSTTDELCRNAAKSANASNGYTILCRAFTLGELVRALPDGTTIKKRMHNAYTAEVYWQNGDVIKDSPEEAAGELYYEILKSKL